MSIKLFIIFNNKMSQKLLIKQKAGKSETTNRPLSSSRKSGGGENANNIKNKSVTLGPNGGGGSVLSSSLKNAKIKNGRPSSSVGGRNKANSTSTKGGFNFRGPYEATKKQTATNTTNIDNLEKRLTFFDDMKTELWFMEEGILDYVEKILQKKELFTQLNTSKVTYSELNDLIGDKMIKSFVKSFEINYDYMYIISNIQDKYNNKDQLSEEHKQFFQQFFPKIINKIENNKIIKMIKLHDELTKINPQNY